MDSHFRAHAGLLPASYRNVLTNGMDEVHAPRYLPKLSTVARTPIVRGSHALLVTSSRERKPRRMPVFLESTCTGPRIHLSASK
jgi:hypothetical protein